MSAHHFKRIDHEIDSSFKNMKMLFTLCIYLLILAIGFYIGFSFGYSNAKKDIKELKEVIKEISKEKRHKWKR